MKSWTSEIGLISELVEVIHLINTQKEGGCFAFETTGNFSGKCEMWGKHCFKKDWFEKLKEAEKICKKIVLVIFPGALI